MANTVIVGGHGQGYIGANDTVIYQHGTVITNAPPPYSMPGSAYPGPYGPPPATITVAPAVIVNNSLGTKPLHTSCQYCQASIITRVNSRATCKTHFCAFGLCFIGCWPCAFIPYCTDDCMGADHYCPNCNSHIGSYNY